MTGEGIRFRGRTWRLALAPALTAAMLLAAIVSGCGRKGAAPGGGAAGPTQGVGPYRVSVQNRPATPSVGDNRLVVTVADTTGAPVRGAELSVVVAMEAMGTMPRMESRGEVKETGPGVYEAKYGIGMAGEWDADIRIRDPRGGQADAAFRLSTSLARVSFVGGTPPVGGGSAGGAVGGARGPGAAGDIPGAVRIDPARRQEIGVRTETIERRDLTQTVRAAGLVAYDETRRAEVSLKFGGWVRDIRVDYTGRAVRAGEVLFTVYSPELFAAQQEYLTALGRSAGGSAPNGAGGDPSIAEAARRRLLLWDISPREIDAIAQAGKPMEAVPIVAPVSGVVVEKNIVLGSALMAGQLLYKIAPIHPVWVMANVYPYELPLIRNGMEATILTPFLPEKFRLGHVSWLSPSMEADTRTAQIRIEVPNERADLRPGMYVDVAFDVRLGKQIAVPESAVLYVGDRRIVFIDLGDGRLAPRNVTLGPRAGDYYAVLAGLKEGEIVVTSGNFLVAAESRLKAAESKW
ncbi:MAG TPA: efflux RND transporter periplasmic adaptor subunit [Candidatus Eisenbacteria bacterium]